MSLDAFEYMLIRSRLADARREAALRGLVAQAKSSNQCGTRRSPLSEHIVRAASRWWPARRIERTVRP